MSEDNTIKAAWLYPTLDLAATQGDKPLRYWKDVLACGSYVHPTQKYPKGHKLEGKPVQFSVGPEDLSVLCASYGEMSAAGDEPPVVKDHAECSDNTLGYIKGARINPANPGRLQMLHEFSDEQARDIALRNKVSAKLHPNYRMSNGKVLSLAISHVATTPKPVITQQDDWAIAAARGSEDDDAPVLFLAAEVPAKETTMKIEDKILQRIKALAPTATEENALELLLSAAETGHKTVGELTAKVAKLEQLPGAVELSAARKTELTESLDTFIELAAMKGQWPDACTKAIKAELSGDVLLLSRNEAGDVRARKIIEAVAPYIKPGLLANGKEKTTLQLSRQDPPNVDGGNDQAPEFDKNPLIQMARQMNGATK